MASSTEGLFDPPKDVEVEDGETFVFTFLQPTKSRKITYRQQQELLRISLEEHEDFNKQGIILDTIEKGVTYPVIHILRSEHEEPLTTLVIGGKTKTSSSSNQKRIQNGGCDFSSDFADLNVCQQQQIEEEKETISLQVSSIKLNKSSDLGPDIYLMQGVYREKKRIEPEFACSPRKNLEHRAFILVGVRNVDPGYNYGLERSWRDITGARTIYHHLHNEHDLCRILFLERTNKCSDVSLFAYIVLVECRCVTSRNRQKILDFVQRMRVQRINTYISIYHDVDAVSPARIGAEVSSMQVNSGAYATKMEWKGKQMSFTPDLAPPAGDQVKIHKSEIRIR